MEFTLIGTDPRFRYLKQRLEADGHRLAPDAEHVIAPPSQREGVPYYDDAIFVEDNAELTAEGALELILRRTDRALSELSVLVAGYGRIGRRLAAKLAALGAKVTVAARRPESRAEAAAMGCRVVDIKNIPGAYDVVVNTVPAPVLTGDYGASFCLELASVPGGWTDKTTAFHAPGLPGTYAPRSGADILAEAVYRALEVDII